MENRKKMFEDVQETKIFAVRADRLANEYAKVDKVHVDGLRRTKNDVIGKSVRDVFQAHNFEQMMRASLEAKTKMLRLGLFNRVDVNIDTSKGTDASYGGYDITFEVKEPRRINSYVGTELGTNEGSCVGRLTMPNAFGRAERLSIDVRYGASYASGVLGLNQVGVHFLKPVNANPNLLWTVGVAQPSVEYPWSGYKEKDRLFTTDLNYNNPLSYNNHTIRWDGVWREVTALSKTVDMSVREQFGHSLKSSAKYIYQRDTRNRRIFPTQGYLVKSETELAGLGGDAKFIKSDLQFTYSYKILSDLVLQMSLAGGCVKGFEPKSQLHLSDRFYLGGPLTMRGYYIHGCGPRNQGCSLGGNTYCLGALHLYSPLPFRAGKGGFSDVFRLHAWANAGNVVNVDYSNLDIKQLGQDMAQGMRFSYGAGLVLNFAGVARLELNYCFPYRASKNDSVCPGWQFGIGMSFL